MIADCPDACLAAAIILSNFYLLFTRYSPTCLPCLPDFLPYPITLCLRNMFVNGLAKKGGEMTRLCYWCGKYMGKKDDKEFPAVFYSVCDECARRLGLDEKLPELVGAIIALRLQNGGKEQSQKSDLPVVAAQ